MAEILPARKACAVNPLKSSTPLGAALAFLGVEGSVPLFHGSQGCTSFALVLAVRHFKEAIPLQTTAMSEASTVLGGGDHLEEALINITQRMKPRFIGIASTALVETRGEDFLGELKTIRGRRPELADTAIVFASTPDFEGGLEEGFGKAAAAVIEELVAPRSRRGESSRRINVLPGVHQTAADIEELRDIVESFGLEPTFFPDLSSALDGHVPDRYVGTSLGGTPLDAIRAMGDAAHTLAIGEHMRCAADVLGAKCGVPATVLDTVTGLEASDQLVALLQEISGRAATTRVRRHRSQLLDAMLDGHFWFGGKRVAIGAEPDLLLSMSRLFSSLGADVVAAVTTTSTSPALRRIPIASVQVGDLADLEDLAADRDAELLVTHSHGRQAADRLGVPLFRVGFPIFDRLGAQHRCSVGYRGTRQQILEIANLLMSELREPSPADFSQVLAPSAGEAGQ